MEVDVRKIVVHPGVFHADECVAAATVLIAAGITSWDRVLLSRIDRSNPTEEDFNDPHVWVLDVGGKLFPAMGNIDHHQDRSLPACNKLVLNYLTQHGHFGLKESILMGEMLFNHVSLVDTKGEKVDNAGVPTLSRIIRGLNGLEGGFEMAMQVAFAAVLSAINAAKAKITAQALWDGVEKHGHYAVNDSPSFISGWQDLAKAEGVNYLITPNREEGKYQILSRDSDEFPIPAHESQTHNGGWMAVYPSKEQAIAHAEERK